MLGYIGTFGCPPPGCSRICFYCLMIVGWFLPYPQPLPCLHYRQNHPSLIPSSFLPFRSYQSHNCWIGGSLDESPAAPSPPKKEIDQKFDQHQLASTSSTTKPMHLTPGLIFEGEKPLRYTNFLPNST